MRQREPVPPEIARRLVPDNADEPLFLKLRQFGKGSPGLSQEGTTWWVIRDDRGRLVGGAKVVPIGRGHPVSLDVAVDPARQGEGWATRLYQGLTEHGIDVEAASAASLAHCSMTLDGYLFMRGRRLRTDPDAESKIVASASICPGCGPLDGSGIKGEPGG